MNSSVKPQRHRGYRDLEAAEPLVPQARRTFRTARKFREKSGGKERSAGRQPQMRRVSRLRILMQV
jgi:hypothetical protein